HILDGRVFDGLLNEVFSNEGVGSLVYGNDYQQIRREPAEGNRKTGKIGKAGREGAVFGHPRPLVP
ncbi:MAG: hypothetical protein ACKOTF_01575, partial [Opitutaceae bacterium]